MGTFFVHFRDNYSFYGQTCNHNRLELNNYACMGISTLPEISDQMANACLVICLQYDSYAMAFRFIRKHIGRKHFLRDYSKQKA